FPEEVPLRSMSKHTFLSIVIACCVYLPRAADGADNPIGLAASNTASAKRITSPLTIEEFRNMALSALAFSRVGMITRFIERVPVDGSAASEKTEAYVAYDDKNLYVVFGCYDSCARTIL